MSTLEQMQAFIAVVEQGSFTAAAQELHVSPTAICKKVTVLEKSLNTRLLLRTTRLIAMTDIGKKYYDQCKKILHEYKISNLLIEDINNNLSGTLNIVCMRDVAKKLVYPSMAMFLEQYPHLVTNVSIKKDPPNITSNTNYDIAIGYDNSENFEDWFCRTINHTKFYYINIKPVPLKIKVYMDFLNLNYK